MKPRFFGQTLRIENIRIAREHREIILLFASISLNNRDDSLVALNSVFWFICFDLLMWKEK